MKYKELTNKYSQTLDKIVENKEISVDEVMNKVDKIHQKIKFEAFGKISVGNKIPKVNGNNKDQVEEEEEKKAKVLFEEQKIKVDAPTSPASTRKTQPTNVSSVLL